VSQVAKLPIPDLGIAKEDAAQRFVQLQDRLMSMWGAMQGMTAAARTIVVVPSQTTEFDITGAEMQAYEERFLFLLLLLRQPRVRLIYVTSQSILPSTIDYYLGLLPGVMASHARNRLFLVAPEDRSDRPLTTKLLERPNLIKHIRSLIPDRENAHLVPYNTTELERDLALLLGIPMYGADPKFFDFGTKSGGRRLFVEEHVAHPIGHENLTCVSDVVAAIIEMRQQKPTMRELMLKLNEGISGEGNAAVNLVGLPSPGTPEEARAVTERVHAMKLEYAGTDHASFIAKLQECGGVVEERIVGNDVRSPSVQLRITPFGELELLSTHDQLLGGPSGQLYVGCCFPADRGYARAISREAIKVGERLAKDGVIGRFAVDFVVVRGADERWQVYAIELNLRKGGTTHPFLTLEYLTDGEYDDITGVFQTPRGTKKYYVASDHLESPLYRTFTPEEFFDITVRRGLHYDQCRQTGAVFHMLPTLSENGRVGVTAIADSREAAEDLFARVRSVLNEEAERARDPITLSAA